MYRFTVLTVFIFLSVASGFGQTFEVRHLAGNPGGPGKADGVGASARFEAPHGMWGDATYLYVGDGGRVRRIRYATGEVTTILTGLTLVGELFGTGGFLYITDGESILRLNLQTRELTTILKTSEKSPPIRKPSSLWGDGRDLYFAEQASFLNRFINEAGSVWKIDLTTNEVSRVPVSNSGSTPTAVWGYARELFIGYINFPSGTATNISAFDLDKGTTRLVTNFGGTRQGPSVDDLWTAGDGSLYMCSYTDGSIYRVTIETGDFQPILRQLNRPNSIWGDGSTLFIVDAGHYAIAKLDLTTLSVMTLAGAEGGNRPVQQLSSDPVSFQGETWTDGLDMYFTLGNEIRKKPIAGGKSTLIARYAEFGLRGVWGDGVYLYAFTDLRVLKVEIASGVITPLAGSPVFSHRDGRGEEAWLQDVQDIWGDGTNLYVSERFYIRKLVIATGDVTTIAGRGTAGADDGPGLSASLNFPYGIWGDGTYLYIADSRNNSVRRMSLATNELVTIARGFDDPHGIWGDGTHLYVTDASFTLRRIHLATGEITTVAGQPREAGYDDGVGSQARFFRNGSITGFSNKVFIADNRLRAVDTFTQQVTTQSDLPIYLADGIGSTARFDGPTGLWSDGSTLYVTDFHALRKIDLRTAEVMTVAGWLGEPGRSDGTGSSARFGAPSAICGDSRYLYIADTFNNSVRTVLIGTWEVRMLATFPRTNLPPAGLWCDANYVYVIEGEGLRRISKITKEVTTLVTDTGVDFRGSSLWGSDGSLYFRTSGNTIKRLELSSGRLTAFAGPFPTAFDLPIHITGDTRNLYVSFTHGVGKVDLQTGSFTVIAGADGIIGSEDGVGTAARFNFPSQVSSDGRNLYVADAGNRSIRVIDVAPPAAATTSLQFSLPARSAITQSTRGSAASVATGYGRIQSATGAPTGIAIFGLRQNGVLVSETAVPSTGLVRSGRLYAENSGAIRTGLAIANPNATAVTLSFYFTDASGANFGAGTAVLDGDQQIARFLDEQPFATTAVNPSRTFTFTSSQPVAAIALRGFVNERSEFLMTTLPVADLSRTSNEAMAIPQFADGGGCSTQVVLVNPIDTPLTGTVEFFDPSGVRTGAAPYSIASRSSETVRLAGTDAVTRVGWIRVTPAVFQTTPLGSTIFSFKSRGVTVTESGVQAMRASSLLWLYAESSNALRSALALANPNASAVTVSLEAVSATGRSIGSVGNITLPPNGQRALFVHEIPGLEQMGGDFRGLLRISTSSSAPISVIGLRGRYNERGDFLIATTMPDAETAPNPSETFFPHFVDGGGYATEFILFSGTSAVGSGTVRFH